MGPRLRAPSPKVPAADEAVNDPSPNTGSMALKVPTRTRSHAIACPVGAGPTVWSSPFSSCRALGADSPDRAPV